MSILLIDPPGWLGHPIVERLVAQQDQVRVLLGEVAMAFGEDLEQRGAHIAYGDALQGDLLERAAVGCRTIVAFDPSDELLHAVIEGAQLAEVGRVVICTSAPNSSQAVRVRGSGLDYVLMTIGRKGMLRTGVSAEAVGEAVDAADDLAGPIELELDLSQDEARRALHLQPR